MDGTKSEVKESGGNEREGMKRRMRDGGAFRGRWGGAPGGKGSGEVYASDLWAEWRV